MPVPRERFGPPSHGPARPGPKVTRGRSCPGRRAGHSPSQRTWDAGSTTRWLRLGRKAPGAGAVMPLAEPVAPPAALTAHTCLRGLNGAAARSAPGFISRAPASDLAPGPRGHVTRRTNESDPGGRARGGEVAPSGLPSRCHHRPARSLPFLPRLRIPCFPDLRAWVRSTVPSPDQRAQQASTSFLFPKVKDMGGT